MIRRVDEEWEFVKFAEDFCVTKRHPVSGREIVSEEAALPILSL